MHRALVAFGMVVLFFFAGCTGMQGMEKATEVSTASEPSTSATGPSETTPAEIYERVTTIEIDEAGTTVLTTEITFSSIGGLDSITLMPGGEYSDFRAFDASGELEVVPDSGGRRITFGEQTEGEYQFSYQFVMPKFATVLGPKTAFKYQNVEGEKVVVKIPHAGVAKEFMPEDVLDFEHYIPVAHYYIEEKNEFKSTDGTDGLVAIIPMYRNFQRQKVLVQKVIPEPEEMLTDAEDNVFAKVNVGNLSAGIPETVTVYAVIETRALEPMDYSEPVSYLANDTYWDVGSPEVSRVAAKLKTGDSYEILKADFDYVSKTLEYVFDPKRHGGEWALINKRGDCEEFSDLFVSLAKAQGIPAAQSVGVAYEGDKSSTISHVWSWAKATKYLPVDASWKQFGRVDNLHVTKCFSGIETDVCGTEIIWEGESRVTMNNSYTMHYLPDIEKAAELTQMIRPLKPGDTLVVDGNLTSTAGISLEKREIGEDTYLIFPVLEPM